MIWKTTNALGQEVTWYDVQELNKIKYKLYLQCNSCGKPDIEITNGYSKCDFCDIGEVLKIIEGLERRNNENRRRNKKMVRFYVF